MNISTSCNGTFKQHIERRHTLPLHNVLTSNKRTMFSQKQKKTSAFGISEMIQRLVIPVLNRKEILTTDSFILTQITRNITAVRIAVTQPRSRYVHPIGTSVIPCN